MTETVTPARPRGHTFVGDPLSELQDQINFLWDWIDRLSGEVESLKAERLEKEVEQAAAEDPADLFPDPPAPYVPDFTIIPDALAKYAEADESAEDFRKRAFSLLFRFGIAEGENFAGGGEPLTPDEKIKLLPMLIANFNAGNWLKLTEDLNPQA